MHVNIGQHNNIVGLEVAVYRQVTVYNRGPLDKGWSKVIKMTTVRNALRRNLIPE
jgi:hypothetical protein